MQTTRTKETWGYLYGVRVVFKRINMPDEQINKPDQLKKETRMGVHEKISDKSLDDVTYTASLQIPVVPLTAH